MSNDAPIVSGDWRKSYAHVFKLPALGCAWEFVRRNPKFVDAWSALKPSWNEAASDHGLKIVHGPADGIPCSPCLWASSAAEDASEASVIWSPSSTDLALKVVAVPPRAAFGGHVLDLEFVQPEKILFFSADGKQQLLLRDGPRSLQLDIRGIPVTEPAALLVDTAADRNCPKLELELLECFRQLRLSGKLPAHCFPPHPYAKRAAQVLLALDGYLAGVSHRDVAIAIFGEDRVVRDWSDPGEHMRDAVRRATARGVALMEGGYRVFLRQL